MGPLECPLCCGASFPDRGSLKYHLLNTTVSCPACHQGFTTIMELANHLDDRCCSDRLQASSDNTDKTGEDDRCYSDHLPASLDNTDFISEDDKYSSDHLLALSDDTDNTARNGKPRMEDSNDLHVASLVERSPTHVDRSLEPVDNSLNYEVVKSRSVIASEDVEEIERWEQDNDKATEFYYFCATCNCTIQGVADHVARFHPDELVVHLQTAEMVTMIPDTTFLDGGTVGECEVPSLAHSVQAECTDVPSDDTVVARELDESIPFSTNLLSDHEYTTSDDSTNKDNPLVFLNNVERGSPSNTVKTVQNSTHQTPLVSKPEVEDEEEDMMREGTTNKNNSPILVNNVVRKRSTTNTVKTVQNSTHQTPLVSKPEVEDEDEDMRDGTTNKNNSPILVNNVVRKRSTTNTMKTVQNNTYQKPVVSKPEVEDEDMMREGTTNKDNSPILVNNVVRKRSTTNTMKTVQNSGPEKSLSSTLVAEHKDSLIDEGHEATDKNNSPILLNNVVRRCSVTNTVKTVESVLPSQTLSSNLEAACTSTSIDNAESKNNSPILLKSNIPTTHNTAEAVDSASTTPAEQEDVAMDWDNTPEENSMLDDDIELNISAYKIGKSVETKRVEVQTLLRDNSNIKSTPATPAGKNDDDNNNADMLNVCDVIEQRHMVDKSGMRYVRNVVKIDKFWENRPLEKSMSKGNKCTEDAPDTGGIDSTNLIGNISRVTLANKVNKPSAPPVTYKRYVIKQVAGKALMSKVHMPSATPKTHKRNAIKQVTGNSSGLTPTTNNDLVTGGEDVVNTTGNSYGDTQMTVITRKIFKSPKTNKATEAVDPSARPPSLITALRQLSKNGPLISIEAASTIILSPNPRPKPNPMPSIYKSLGLTIDNANGLDNAQVNSVEELMSTCAVRKARAKPKSKKMTLATLQKKMKCARKALFKLGTDGSPVDSIIVCSSCRNEFPNQSRFSDHECQPELDSKNATVDCETCGIMCMTSGDLNIHRATHGSDPRRLEQAIRRERHCETCEQVSYSPATFRAHYNAHVRECRGADTTMPALGIISCTKCSLVFPNDEQLRRHWRLHPPDSGDEGEGEEATVQFTPEDGDMFTCDVCGKLLPEGGREAHRLMHQGMQKIHCEICNKPFPQEADVALHMVVHNKPDASLACFYCKLKFDNVYLLRTHVVESHTVFDRPYLCSFCGRRFYKALDKRRHELIHTGEKNHKCDVCGAKFLSVDRLRMHTRIHTGVRPYECRHCGKPFRTVSGVKHHEEIHATDRPYACPLCPKTFKSQVHLRNHKNHHSKPFTCTCCGRRFTDLFTLRGHVKAHSKGTLKYVCYVCGASYGREYILRDHMKSHPEHYSESQDNDTSATQNNNKSAKSRRKRKRSMKSSSDSSD